MLQRVSCVVMFFCLGMSLQAAGDGKLTGTPIGSTNWDYSAGAPSTTVNTPACAFDGNTDTYYASQERSNTWVGLDLGTPHVITRVGWVPRTGQGGRVQLALFEGANNADFTDAVPLYLIPEAGADRRHDYADVNVSRGFRYVRYVGPNDARCCVSEVEFYGHEGTGDDSRFYQITNLPTLSIHTQAGTDPADKVNEMPSQMVLVYDGGTRLQEYPMLIRGRGNASWSFPKKPYRIKFNDGKSHHMLKDSPQESPAKAKKWTLINNYGDKTLMRNCLAFELSRRLGLAYTPYCQPVDVILNGEYKGCYQLCDQITIDKSRVAITEITPDDTSGDALTGGYLVEVDAYAGSETNAFTSTRGIPVTIKAPGDDDITGSQKTYIRRAFNTMEASLWASNYKDEAVGYRSKLDVESFLRHFIVGEMSGNTDTYWSTYMYKERNQTPFHVGPVWDFDLAFDNDTRIYPVSNRTNWVYRSGGSSADNMSSFVTRVLSDPYATTRLKMIWAEMRRSGAFTKESLIAYVDSMAQVLDASQRLNFIRWPIMNQRVHQNPKIYGSYAGEVNVLRDYFDTRLDWIDNFLDYGVNKVYNDSVFYISSAAELVEFAEAVNSGAARSEGYLTKDINMAGYSELFLPIGSGVHPFVGIFDGRGHSISNLHLAGGKNWGVFGTVGDGVQIRNFVLDSSCSISGDSYVGIVGSSTGDGLVTIERVGNEAAITGTGVNVAGIIGCNYGSTCRFVIRDCYNAGNITGADESAAISGWLGQDAEMTGCWNSGVITGCLKGLEMARYSVSVDMTGCYNTSGKQVTLVDEAAVASGELCWMLNQPKGDCPIWYQKLGTDPHPMFGSAHGLVVKNDDGTYSNTDVKPGDVNQDDALTLVDADWEAEHIVGRTPENFAVYNSDVNNDGEVNVLDVVAIVDATAGKETEFTPGTQSNVRIYSSNASVKAGGQRTVYVWLSSPQTLTACQADVVVSGGLSVDTTAVSVGNLHSGTHVLKYGEQDGTMRILSYSTDNAPLKSKSGTLVTLKLQADEAFTGGTLTLANQVLTSAEGDVYRPDDVSYNVTLSNTYVTDIQFSEEELAMQVGDIHRLGVTVLPATATKQTLTWTSSDESVATVDAYGTITAKSLGSVTITAQATDGSGVRATMHVEVVDGMGVMDIESVPETAEIYTLQGVRVSKLKHAGVYIVNGTKVLVR